MKTSLDCIHCLVRQTLDAARMAVTDTCVHERIMRDVLHWASEMDFNAPPPVLAQRIHRRLRQMTGVADPYREAKEHLNQMALDLLPEMEAKIKAAQEPLFMAVRLAIAGNVIDLGVSSSVTESDVRQSVSQALSEPVQGMYDEFRHAVAKARRILYLADNAGEIVFDRLLIEQLLPSKVTVAVRGSPVINDATIFDARTAGLHEIAEIIDNGSDAPGTVLKDCSEVFRRSFAEADMILAKGQGNFESLSEEQGSIFFLFKVKCSVIADHAGLPIGATVITHNKHMLRKTP